MKVVHLNTYDGNGGAGRAALRLNKALKQEGIESSVLSLYQFNPRSGVATAFHTFWGKLRAIGNIFFERYAVLPFLKNRDVPFSLNSAGFPVHDHPLVRAADIIHLHWVNHGFLSPSDIQALNKLGKKIVWTLHDANPVTGGCHVKYGCTHYTRSCGMCPVLVDPGPQDVSHRIWQRKYNAYGDMPIHYIGPSHWMKDVVRQSAIARDAAVSTIGNSLEMDIFQPSDKMACRDKLGIASSAKVILAGFMPSKFSRHKGLEELIKALQQLADLYAGSAQDIQLYFFGPEASHLQEQLPFPAKFTGTIKDDELLARYYAAADVFVMTSLDENLSYTAMESLACGTPVAAFNVGGFSDLVRHGENGHLAPTGDTGELAKSIQWVLEHPRPAELSAVARQWVASNYNPVEIARQHIQLYQSL